MLVALRAGKHQHVLSFSLPTFRPPKRKRHRTKSDCRSSRLNQHFAPIHEVLLGGGWRRVRVLPGIQCKPRVATRPTLFQTCQLSRSSHPAFSFREPGMAERSWRHRGTTRLEKPSAKDYRAG